jgi:dTDP-4-dehydrorhamnose reductase
MAPTATILTLPPRLPALEVPALELWGGVECSIARIRGRVVDQLRLTGHHDRPGDSAAIAALGVKAVRYPVLWEMVMAAGVDGAPDWAWTDARLAALRDHGVRPVATLLHHGHGPADTSLADPGFIARFADYAGRVAARYPWLGAYTPINEPLTTARFCGLYGFWHPHAADHRSFLRLLITQILAIRAAMAAIRAVNPAARLVQSEDLGRAHSTPRLAYQAAFENERRWLTLDLLCGRVVPGHPLWRYLVKGGIQAELEDLAARPCPPDLYAVDHYLSSERFLDERLERYPGWSHGGNERERYADVEAVRVVAEGVHGYERLLREAWERYRIPVAAGEVHYGGSREEQMRWLNETWDSARRLRQDGVDIRAVTVWALFGSVDWNSLMMRSTGHYEPGPYDIRAGTPRPTGLARLMRGLAAGTAAHPVLDAPGWWHRADRFQWPPVRCCPYTASARPWSRSAARPLAILPGAAGLADALARRCVARGLPYIRLDRGGIEAGLARHRPWAVIDPGGGPGGEGRVCAAAGVPLLVFTTAPAPGAGPRSEAAGLHPAEALLLAAWPGTLLVRSGPVFGSSDAEDFAARWRRDLGRGRVLRVPAGLVSPAYAPDLADAALDLLIDGETGLWHLACRGAVTWIDFARALARHWGGRAVPVRGEAASHALTSDRAPPLPAFDTALEAYVEALAAEPVSGEEPLGPVGEFPPVAFG